MNTEINLEYYQVFYYVAKLGSISRAAGALHLTQPAVSHIIKTLESKLGSKLFYRQPRGVELTDAGSTLLPYVSSMLSQISAGEKRILKISNLEDGDLYIGAVETAFSDGLLPLFLRRFNMAHPGIRVHLRGPNSTSILEEIASGTLDLGFAVSPVEELSDRLRFISVRETRDIFIAGEGYGRFRDRIVPLGEILAEPLICLHRGMSGRNSLEEFMKEQGQSLNPAFSVYSPTMIVPLVEAGLGIGVLIEECAKPSLASGRCFAVSSDTLLPERRLYMVVSREFQPSIACRTFLSMIEELSR